MFITDGELHDLDEVKRYSTQLAREISARRRNPLKFVLIGVGESVSESQMEDLDDLDTGTDVDLWDHKLAAEMRVLQEIFAEVVDKNARVANNGRILDAHGQLVKDYSDTGLPAFLEFEMPAGSDFFTLDVNGKRVQQPLSDRRAGRQLRPPPLRPSLSRWRRERHPCRGQTRSAAEQAGRGGRRRRRMEGPAAGIRSRRGEDRSARGTTRRRVSACESRGRAGGVNHAHTVRRTAGNDLPVAAFARIDLPVAAFARMRGNSERSPLNCVRMG